MVGQGAVKVDGEKVTDPGRALAAGKTYLIQAAKRRFLRVRIEQGTGKKTNNNT